MFYLEGNFSMMMLRGKHKSEYITSLIHLNAITLLISNPKDKKLVEKFKRSINTLFIFNAIDKKFVEKFEDVLEENKH